MTTSRPSSPLVLTTSWDDGHPLDLKLADLLAKHGIKGTFYTPLQSQRPTMSPAQLKELSTHFEIGGHTLSHVDLIQTPFHIAQSEITQCRLQLQQITGQPCTSFCFPLGHFRASHVKLVKDAGFQLARTVEWMSFDFPRHHHGIAILPTTLQANATSWSALLRNSIKRFKPFNLIRSLRTHGPSWEATLTNLIQLWLHQGGVFHLWGHSWEIDEASDWNRLDRTLAIFAQLHSQIQFRTNDELLDPKLLTHLTPAGTHTF
jgi:peptidoglycan/xylan/chitin deacetylase (PgdA/CDA1 family)